MKQPVKDATIRAGGKSRKLTLDLDDVLMPT
jgi:hypothetical protein